MLMLKNIISPVIGWMRRAPFQTSFNPKSADRAPGEERSQQRTRSESAWRGRRVARGPTGCQ